MPIMSAAIAASHLTSLLKPRILEQTNNFCQQHEQKWNESGFRPPLCTYRLNWARRTSWGWWDDCDDTVLQTQDSKFEPWRSEAEHATSRSRRLPAILTFTRGWGRNIFCFFETAETGNRTPNSGVKGSGANHYPRAPAQQHEQVDKNWTTFLSSNICQQVDTFNNFATMSRKHVDTLDTIAQSHTIAISGNMSTYNMSIHWTTLLRLTIFRSIFHSMSTVTIHTLNPLPFCLNVEFLKKKDLRSKR